MNRPATESQLNAIGGLYRLFYKTLECIPVALPVLVMRVGVALVFWRAGQSKLPFGNDGTVALFRDIYQLPVLSPEATAYLATAIELSGPVLLVIGFLTRPAAAILLAQTMVIQIFIFPMNYPDHLLWAGPLHYLLLRGPGKWSFDAAIRDRIGGR